MIQIRAALFSNSAKLNFEKSDWNYQMVLLQEAPVGAVIPAEYQNSVELNRSFKAASDRLKAV